MALSITKPIVGGDSNIWATKLNNALDEIVAAINGKSESSHKHAAADITSGTFAPERLGSGVANATTVLKGNSTWGVFAHDELGGLEDDDHPQYLNLARGDARYPTFSYVQSTFYDKNTVDNLLSGVSAGTGFLTKEVADGLYAALGHNHDGTYSPVSHNHDGVYSPESHHHNSYYTWASNGGGEYFGDMGSTAVNFVIDLSYGNVIQIVLQDDIHITIDESTLTGEPFRAHSFTLIAIQDEEGGRAPTWGDNIAWPGGTAPELSSEPGAIDVITFLTVDDGATWLGFVSGLGMAVPE